MTRLRALFSGTLSASIRASRCVARCSAGTLFPGARYRALRCVVAVADLFLYLEIWVLSRWPARRGTRLRAVGIGRRRWQGRPAPDSGFRRICGAVGPPDHRSHIPTRYFGHDELDAPRIVHQSDPIRGRINPGIRPPWRHMSRSSGRRNLRAPTRGSRRVAGAPRRQPRAIRCDPSGARTPSGLEPIQGVASSNTRTDSGRRKRSTTRPPPRKAPICKMDSTRITTDMPSMRMPANTTASIRATLAPATTITMPTWWRISRSDSGSRSS